MEHVLLFAIPKKDKDLRYIENFRPLSLLNTDYKILAKALARRLQPLLKQLTALALNTDTYVVA